VKALSEPAEPGQRAVAGMTGGLWAIPNVVVD
jgi:hypothetical protein